DLESIKEPKTGAAGDAATVFPESPAPVVALASLTGGQTVVAGDEKGRLAGLSRLRENPESETRALKRVHVYEASGAAITSIAPAPRGKTFLVADASGLVTYDDATNERTVVAVHAPEAAAQVVVAPKLDGFLALGPSGLSSFALNAPHPETSFRALFG